MWNASRFCVSSLRRGHANLLCIVPILTDDPRRESSTEKFCVETAAARTKFMNAQVSQQYAARVVLALGGNSCNPQGGLGVVVHWSLVCPAVHVDVLPQPSK